MIRARLSNGTFVFGLDPVNIARLMEGQPIEVDLTELGGTDTFLLMFGISPQHIVDQLREATGSDVPPAQPYITGHD